MLPSLFCFYLQYQILKELSLRMILTIPPCVLNSFFCISVNSSPSFLLTLFCCCLQIFVGGLDPNVTEDALKQVFSPYGEVVHVKIPVGKRCGFVQFVTRLTFIYSFGLLACICKGIFVLVTMTMHFRPSAEQALLMLQGALIGAQNVRLSWGRSLSNKQAQVISCIPLFFLPCCIV